MQTNIGLDFKLETEPNPNWKKLEKTSKPEKTRAKSEKTESNRFEPVFVLKNRIELKPVGLNRFRFFLNSVWLHFFFIKTEPNWK